MKSDNQKLFRNIAAPLGFFAFALLIIGTFLSAVLIFGNLIEEAKLIGLYFVAGLFGAIIIIVTCLVWLRPEHLTYDMEAHLRERGKPPLGTKDRVAELSSLKTSLTEKQ